ncbi:hypothetical protein M413DRAFT_443578 [Hebeloma cylindrosporum]|uniref:Crinkler effector protein N-terminal domain-containing protein n=1 Tax=Hebeloma cylindrosporum TaxID=76867 RepID=A0A0C3CIZ7_HEBCY|nr:hypothetical protein M413DRAFT_443578 [Hebeloma cylindrosporum h7]
MSSLKHRSDGKFRLLSWILGVSEDPFLIVIETGLKVSHLKDAIKQKKENSLHGIDSNALEIWKLCPPVFDENIDAEIGQLSSPEEIPGSVKLNDLDELSQHFPSPPRQHLHVIVQLPPMGEHPPKRRRMGDPETPHTPQRMTQAGLSTEDSPPRLNRPDTVAAMDNAFKPFVKYIDCLAKGRLDGYFDALESEPIGADLEPGVSLPPKLLLLLHNLGMGKNDERVQRAFVSLTVHLFGPQGSGKTRLSLEGLCHSWGFYISCHGDSSTRATGSTDFRRATAMMESMKSWDAGGGTDMPQSNKNVDPANRVFEMLICARIYVLKQLLANLPAGTDAMKARRRWVLVQALPPSTTTDIFVAIVNSLRSADTSVMRELSLNMFSEIKDLVGPDIFPGNPFFTVVDEAQVAAQHLTNSFRSSTTGTHQRPVLHAFCSFLRNNDLVGGIILSGTGLSMEMVKTAVESTYMKDMDSTPRIITEIGRFERGDEAHRSYIQKFLSINSPSDHRLVERILYWFSGRYRPTASLLEILLTTAQQSSRHRIFTALVRHWTSFKLTDAIDLEENEPELTPKTVDSLVRYGPLSVAGRLFDQGSPNYELIKHLLNVLMRWRIGSQPTTIPLENHMRELVGLGIGLLEAQDTEQRKDPDNLPVRLCEPLVVLHLSSVFQKHGQMSNQTWITDAFRAARGKATLGTIFEEVTAMVLLQKFGGDPCALSDVFCCDQLWGSRKVTLVALKRGADDEMQCSPISWTSGDSDCLGYKADSPLSVLSFFQDPRGKAFLFPDNLMGSDVFAFLRDVDSGELILVGIQTKIKNSLDSATSQWISALDSITPDFFYTANTKGGRIQYVPLKYTDVLQDINDVLDSSLGSGEYTPVIKHDYSLLSYKDSDQKLASRQTPRYLRIIATPNDEQNRRLKAELKGDVGVLRSDLVEEFVRSTAGHIAF